MPFYEDQKEVNNMKEGLHPNYEQTTIQLRLRQCLYDWFYQEGHQG